MRWDFSDFFFFLSLRKIFISDKIISIIKDKANTSLSPSFQVAVISMNIGITEYHLNICLHACGKLLQPFLGRNSSFSEFFPFLQVFHFAFFIKGWIIMVSS